MSRQKIKLGCSLLATFLFLTCAAQEDTSLTRVQRFVQNNKFVHNFIFADTTCQTYLFTAALKYQYTLSTKTFAANGAYVSFGINLARLFSKKVLLGAFFDFRPLYGLGYNQPRSSAFANDFADHFNSAYDTSEDSAKAKIFKNAMAGKGLSGSAFGCFGAMLSLFPNKFGGILLSFKYASSSYRIGGVYGNRSYKNGEAEHLYFTAYPNYVFELTFKPYALSENSYIYFESEDSKNIWKTITLSFYYEKFNLRNADLDGLKFSSMVSSDFMKKYGLTDRFGISFGISLY